MKVAQSNFTPSPVVASKAAPAAAPTTAAVEPQDSVVTASGTPAPKEGSDAGQFVKMGVTGLSTLGLAVPAMYAGVLGGGIVGSLFGAGVAPAIASVSSHGALDFIGSAFHTTGLGAQVGIVVGGLSGLIGAAAVGHSMGNGAARVFGVTHETKPSDLKATTGAVPTVLAGLGALGGATGGAIIGAGVAAAGSITHGLLAQGVAGAFAGAPVAAAIGGSVGLVTFGLIGGKGGIALAKGTDHAGTFIKNTYNHILGKTGDGESLDAKNVRLQALQKDLKGKQADLADQTQTARTSYNDDKSKIDAREAGVVAQETDVKNRENAIDTKIEAEGQAKFTERSQDLRDWKAKLDVREGQQNAQHAATIAREQQIDTEITNESNKIFAQRRQPLEANYKNLQGQLDTKESGLNDYESRIAQQTETQYQQTLAPLESDLRNQISNATTQESYAAQRRNEAQNEANQAAGQRSQAESQLSSAQSAHNSAQNTVDELNTSIANLRQQLSEQQGVASELRTKEAEIAARENK